jgi:transposase
MKILALDLGKYKSVACVYETTSLTHRFVTIVTTPKALHDLLVAEEPERVVIEICPLAGWVGDLVAALDIELEVASTTHEAWRWKNVKRKNDRQDGLKLAQLSALGQLTLVHQPEPGVRQWRALINYRQRLVSRRTKIRNRIRALLLRQAVAMGRGSKAWTQAGIAQLEALARPLSEVSREELWRGELGLELAALTALAEPLLQVEQKLNELGEADERVQLLRTIPGVGPRGGEALVAVIDEARRF